MEDLINEIEGAVRSNLRNFDSMYQAVNSIFHRDLDGKEPKYQSGYIQALMKRFTNKKYWFFSFPSVRRIQLMGAIAIARKFSDRSESLAKLVEAGEAILNTNIGTFKMCFNIGAANTTPNGPEKYY